MYDSGVAGAGGVGGFWAIFSDTDGLEDGAGRWDDSCWWAAALVKDICKGGGNGLDIGHGNAEGGCCETDVLDEVADFSVVESHEFMDLVL